MGKSLFKYIRTQTWVNPFLNGLFLKAVPQFSTSYIIRKINQVFNGLCLISLKFLGNKILGGKVMWLSGNLVSSVKKK